MSGVRVPKDSLREQLALAATEIIRLRAAAAERGRLANMVPKGWSVLPPRRSLGQRIADYLLGPVA